MEREKLSSRLGFILLSAGCAIGIGNVWKFPYMVGQYGGAAFVLIYIFFLAIMGIPVLTMEFAMGRASQKSPVNMYDALSANASKWRWHGYTALAANYILMMFYTTVAGWIINYFFKMASGRFEGATPAGVGEIFTKMIGDPVESVVFMGITVLLGFLVCALGLKNGVEKITKYMMLVLLAIMGVLAVNSIFLQGGEEGLKFYLLPNIENIQKVGLGNVIVAAMNQAFFTLSLGIGCMAIFGSYLDKKRSLLGESINVAALDTFVAFTSGLIMFPAAFAYGIPVDSGPNLIFVTLPNVFNNLPGGRIWGSLFFVFISFAALSTVFAVLENIIACSTELFRISRKKACIINGAAMLVLSLPCALGFNLLSGIVPFAEGTSILDLEDFIVNNLMIPIGAFIYVIFCTRRFGWGFDNFINEANIGKGLKVKKWMRIYMTYILPLMILVILGYGLITFNYG